MWQCRRMTVLSAFQAIDIDVEWWVLVAVERRWSWGKSTGQAVRKVAITMRVRIESRAC